MKKGFMYMLAWSTLVLGSCAMQDCLKEANSYRNEINSLYKKLGVSKKIYDAVNGMLDVAERQCRKPGKAAEARDTFEQLKYTIRMIGDL